MCYQFFHFSCISNKLQAAHSSPRSASYHRTAACLSRYTFYRVLYCVLTYGPHLVRKQDNFPAKESKDTQFPYSLYSGPEARVDGVRFPLRAFPILSFTATRPVCTQPAFVSSVYYQLGLSECKAARYEDGLNAETKDAHSCIPFTHGAALKHGDEFIFSPTLYQTLKTQPSNWLDCSYTAWVSFCTTMESTPPHRTST